MGGVESPTDVRGVDPVGESGQVVVAEAEALAHRSERHEVEDRRSVEPTCDQVEQGRRGGEHGVRVADGTIGDAVAQRRRRCVGVMAAMSRRVVDRRPEDCLDDRGEPLEVGADDEQVVLSERQLVVGQEVHEHVAQHLDLPRRAVAGMELHGPVIRERNEVAGRRTIRGDVVVQLRQDGHRCAAARCRLGDGLRGRQAAGRRIGQQHGRLPVQTTPGSDQGMLDRRGSGIVGSQPDRPGRG